jgi:hypothetical protein
MTELPRFSDAAILAARGSREAVDPTMPYAHFVEPEPTPEGRIEDVATVFVTNRECSFRCLVCDLWKHTTGRDAVSASVAEQVGWALAKLPRTSHVKIYNSGSFFDTQAISRNDRARIGELVEGRQTLIVECHPRLVNQDCAEFAAAIAPVRLQVAIGLETVDPALLPRLNKGMSLYDFERAVRFLMECGVDVRAFVLLGPPGHRGDQAVLWAKRSLDHAFSLGVECCVVIPVRPGNGIVDELERKGFFARPVLSELEAVIVHGLRTARWPEGERVFADLWDIEDFFDCANCSALRAAALRRMNLTQLPAVPVRCSCGERAG